MISRRLLKWTSFSAAWIITSASAFAYSPPQRGGAKDGDPIIGDGDVLEIVIDDVDIEPRPTCRPGYTDFPSDKQHPKNDGFDPWLSSILSWLGYGARHVQQ